MFSALVATSRVLQCVARVHEVGWLHLDLKPEHFMRFPCGQWKLVDYGSAHREGATVAPAHSRRYCAPELAAMVEASGLHATRQVEPSLDVWAAGALLFALFRGAPLFGDGVSYAEIAMALDSISKIEEAILVAAREYRKTNGEIGRASCRERV